MAVDESLKRPAFVKRNLMELVSNVAPVEAPADPPPLPVAEELDFQPPPKKSDPLPRPGDGYRPHARFVSRLGSDQRMIYFVHGNFVYTGFTYHDLRHVNMEQGSQPGQGLVLMLRFIEAEVTEVTITGRNLDDLLFYISEGSMPWVWEQPKGFKPANDLATVITGITFSKFEQ